MGEGHLAGAAVAGDAQQGRAGLEIEVAGQFASVFPLEACAELAADAVTGVHEWGRGRGRCADFERRLDGCYAMISIDFLSQVIGDVVGRHKRSRGILYRFVLWSTLVDWSGDGVGAVEQVDGLAAHACQ